MSAPPIAITRCTPSAPASAVITRIQTRPAPSSAIANGTPRPTIARATIALSRWRPGKRSGLPLSEPRSFAQAITDPVKVIAPTATPTQISTRCTTRSAPTSACSPICTYEPMPTSTAARPTKLCRTATSSGMPVISTRLASTAPMPPPIAMAPIKRPRPSTGSSG